MHILEVLGWHTCNHILGHYYNDVLNSPFCYLAVCAILIYLTAITPAIFLSPGRQSGSGMVELLPCCNIASSKDRKARELMGSANSHLSLPFTHVQSQVFFVRVLYKCYDPLCSSCSTRPKTSPARESLPTSLNYWYSRPLRIMRHCRYIGTGSHKTFWFLYARIQQRIIDNGIMATS